MKKIKFIFLTAISYLASFIIPKDKNIWIFGGSRGLRFADNSRYFYLYCLKNTNKRCIWLASSNEVLSKVRENGGEGLHINSFLGWWYGLRAEWHIFDVSPVDTGFYNSIGARHLNLWHGMPLKNLEKMYQAGGLKGKLKQLLKRLVLRVGLKNQNSYMAYPNKKYSRQYVSAFGVPPENVILANQPRNEVFQTACYKTKAESLLAGEIRALKDQGFKVIGYFPTWRSGGKENFLGVESYEQLVQLNDLLKKQNAYLVAKRHSCSFAQYQHSGYSQQAELNQKNIEGLSQFLAVDFEVDLNSILPQMDVLVSDYSGAIFDFLLTEQPIILYCYDLDVYQIDPGLYFDFESDFKVGPLARNFEELLQQVGFYLQESNQFVMNYLAERQGQKERFFEVQESSKILLEFLNNRGLK